MERPNRSIERIEAPQRYSGRRQLEQDAQRAVTAVMFDLFGTLVAYDPGRTAQAYDGSYAVLRRRGFDLSYAEFVATWDALFATFESASNLENDEFSMYDLFEAYVAERLPDARSDAAEFVQTYLSEWGQPIRVIDGVREMLVTLRARGHRTVVVSNTHHAPMVAKLLKRFAIGDQFDAVVTSIEHGKKKPHPSIYRSALRAVSVEPANAVFIGDSYVPDYEGPRSVGIDAYLVGPATSDVPVEHRLSHVADIAAVLDGRSP